MALFPKVPKIQRPKTLKIYVFDYPTVVWRLLSRNHREYPQKLILRQTRVIGLHLPCR